MEQRRGIDILAIVFAGLSLFVAGAGLFLQPTYRQVFSEFGGALPRFTLLMLQPATLVIAGLCPALLVAAGVIQRRSEQEMVAASVIALLVAIGLVIAFGMAMSLPLMELAPMIR